MSTGFSFGANTTGAPAFGTSSLSFGTPQTSTSQFGFGSNTQQQQQQQQNTGFQLGSNTSFNKPTGSVAPQPTNLSFGTPAPNLTSALSFGATSAAAPSALGTGLTFGAPAASTAPTGFSIGGPSVGIGAITSTPGLSFGTPASISTGFGGIQPTTTPVAGSTGGLSFGNLPASTTTFNLGTTAPPQFGATTAITTPAVAPLNLTTSLGGTSTGFSLGGITNTAAATTSGFTLGGFTSTSTTPALNFGTSTTGSSLTSTPSIPLSFGPPSSAPQTLNFGSSSTTAASTSALTFGATPIPASTNFSLTAATSQPEKFGLGGIQTSIATSSGTSAVKEVPPKEQQLPNEIQQDIENFKNYIKQQKLYSSDVSRCCVKDFRSVEAQIGVLTNVIKEIESQLQRNRCLAEKLKFDTAQGLQLIEMAQRTQDTPAGLQYENVAPMNFFLGLADKFEKEMHALKIQIENTDKYVKNCGQPATLTSQDLSLGMKRLHDTFVSLAGRLQSVHTQVESQKELYTNLRKQLANDFCNPFEALDRKFNPNQTQTSSVIHSPPKIGCGPTPFNQIINSNFPITRPQNVGSPYPGMPSSTTGFNASSQTLPNLFGNAPNLNKTVTFGVSPSSTSFQLQKPPTGNKRGKQ